MIQPGMVIPHSVGGWAYTVQIDGETVAFDEMYTSAYDAKTAMREKVEELKENELDTKHRYGIIHSSSKRHSQGENDEV